MESHWEKSWEPHWVMHWDQSLALCLVQHLGYQKGLHWDHCLGCRWG